MMRHGLFRLLLAGWVAVAPALAQVPDPTRPAGVLVTPGAAGTVGAAVVPVESGVQTVILRPKGKSAAVIGGQYVEVGGKLGDKRVVKITESEVVLQGEGGREIMKVTPDIEKVPVKKKPAAKRRTTGTTGPTGTTEK
jgi:hypothetical protein